MLNEKKNILFDIGKVFLNTFLFLLTCFLIGLIYLIFLSKDLPSLKELQKFNPEQVSKIMSSAHFLAPEQNQPSGSLVTFFKIFNIRV